jgi:maltooligosyltrehalose trehalohydrolase
VREGRLEFLAQFPSIAGAAVRARVPPPEALETFTGCKLDPAERARHAGERALHRDLLRLRREDPVFRAQGEGGFDGAVLAPHAFALRWFGGGDGDRLLVVNLGADLHLARVPEPLLAPPDGQAWATALTSEDPRYGGHGAMPLREDGWRVTAECAFVLRSEPRR